MSPGAADAESDSFAQLGRVGGVIRGEVGRDVCPVPPAKLLKSRAEPESRAWVKRGCEEEEQRYRPKERRCARASACGIESKRLR